MWRLTAYEWKAHPLALVMHFGVPRVIYSPVWRGIDAAVSLLKGKGEIWGSASIIKVSSVSILL